MATYMDGPHDNGRISMEDVAEEVLNGLFCHYEPPTTDDQKRRAFEKLRVNPHGYDEPNEDGIQESYRYKQGQSILRRSGLVRRQKKQTKTVTWRDEQSTNARNANATNCAETNCDFLRACTKGNAPAPPPPPPLRTSNSALKGRNATPTARPTSPGRRMSDPIDAYRSGAPIHTQGSKNSMGKQTGTKTGVTLQAVKGESGRVLYDDEGNPILEEVPDDKRPPPLSPRDENIPPSMLPPSPRPPSPHHPPPYQYSQSPRRENRTPPRKASTPSLLDSLCVPVMFSEQVCGPPPTTPPTTTGYRGKRVDVYEPQNYDNIPSSQSLPYRRIRSPPVRNYRRDDDYYYHDDPHVSDYAPPPRRSRSASPVSRRSRPDSLEPVRDDNFLPPEESAPPVPRQSSSRKSWYKRWRRPQTPHRRDGAEDVEEENEQDEPVYESDTDSSLVERLGRAVRGGKGSKSGRSPSRSPIPSPRQMYDMDDDDSGIVDETDQRQSRPSRSPDHRRSESRERKDSREFDYQSDRRRSREYDESPGRRRSSEYDESQDRRRSHEYDQSPARRRSRDFEDDRRRSRDYDNEYPERRRSRDGGDYGEYDDLDRRQYVYGEVPDRHRSRDYDDDRAHGRSRDYDRRVSEGSKHEYEDRRASSSPYNRSSSPYDRSDDPANSPRSKRTWKYGRKSSDDGAVDEYYESDRRGQGDDRGPPTPDSRLHADERRQADDDGYDYDYDYHRPSRGSDRGRRSSSEKDYDADARNRDPTPTRRRTQNDALPPTPRRSAPPKLDTTQSSAALAQAAAEKALSRTLSPTSLATDDEIREEVSSVGMGSNNERDYYPNPFFEAAQKKVVNDNATQDSDPSTLTSPSPNSSRDESDQSRTYPGSTGGGSSKSSILGKLRKGLGKVKKIVKDIDQQRLPPPYPTNQPVTPTKAAAKE